MRKLMVGIIVLVTAVYASATPVLISVDLPTIENKKAWHQLGIPTYELIGNTAIAEADESQISVLENKGYLVNIIDKRPELAKYVTVSDVERIPELPGTSIWQTDKMAIIRAVTKDTMKDIKYKHQIRPFNTRPLGDRFWKSVTTKYIPLKSIPYDPFIQSLVDQVNADSITSYIQRLQDFKTRHIFTDSSYAASQWIFDKYKAYGLTAELDSIYLPKPTGDSAYIRSVIGYMPGYLTQSEIIASGHFDSENNYGDPDSFAPGADDNASGTAATIEVARIFSKQSCPVRIVCAAWDGEESAKPSGSLHYADQAVSNNIDILSVINMDMIGYMNDSVYDCIAGGTTWLTYLFMQASQMYSEGMVIYLSMDGVSDDVFFYNLGYPAMGCIENPWIDTGAYPYYHSPEDLLDKLTPKLFTEITKTAVATTAILAFCPSKVSDVSVTQTDNDTSLLLTWSANQELNVVGYWIWWGDQSDLYTDSLYVPGRLTDSITITGLEPDKIQYFIIRATTDLNHMSYLAEEVYGTPVIFSLDQGILVIDETYNWTTGSFPRDAQQDSFYNYIMAGYKYIQYEFGNDDQKPTMLNFCPYSTIAWFADDNTSLLSSGAIIDLKNYLEHGGKLWFAGWKPTGDIRNNAIYPVDFISGSFLYDNMKISHAELSGATDSFQTAIGLKGYPDISVDTLKYPSTVWGKTFRYIEALSPTSTGDTIYVMDMKNSGSIFEGRACAVRDSGKTVFFGFPLYFMDREQIKLAVQKVMAEFGEPSGVTTERPGDSGQRPVFRLYQNAPNPFSRQTTIRYQLSNNGHVSLRIYNIAGQMVKTLVNEVQQAGSYAISWDGIYKNGKEAPDGVYFCRLTALDIQRSIRFILLK